MVRGKFVIFVSLTSLVLFVLAQTVFSLVDNRQYSNEPNAGQYFSTGITYQGTLQDENGPINGLCDLRFALYDANYDGSKIGDTLTKEAISIVDGYFTVYDLDFGAGIFNGRQRFLEVSLRCPAGSGSYTKLEPRQELAPAPSALAIPGLYSMPADGSYNLIGGADGNSMPDNLRGGTIGGGGTDWLPNRVSDDYGTIAGGEGNKAGNDDAILDNAEHSTVGGGKQNEASGHLSTIAGGSSNLAGGIHAAIGGGGANQATGDYNATVGGGNENIASGTDSTVGGGTLNHSVGWAGTVGGGHKNIAAGGASAVSGGESNVAQNNYSSVGGGFQNLAYGSMATVGGGMSNQVYADYGTIAGGGSEESDTSNIIEVNADWGTIGGGDRNLIQQPWGTIGGGYWNAVLGNHATVSGGVNNIAAGSWATIPGGMDNQAQGVGSFAAGTRANAQHNGSFIWSDSLGGSFATGKPNQFAVRARGGVFFETGDEEVSVNVLEIRGGSDLAEPFIITGEDNVRPGTVVSIDPANPGNLQISSQANDRLVAGCVSGANGVNPGLIMQQEGTNAAGTVPVALSGRVYCLADASTRLIVPGDLLTTSALPGHLTAVSDFQQAQGAIVGKAMTGLEAGQGFVLVLVGLQ